MRVLFAGTPEFAVVQLQALHDAPTCQLVGVCTQPDRPAGRGRRLRASAVKRWRERHAAQTPLLQPERLDDDALRAWRALRPELVITAAYGLILPAAALATPASGCLNVHASLLPRWRGAAPVQRAIAAGDDETGVTLIRMDEGLDSGPVIAQRRCPIEADDTGAALESKLATLGAALLIETLAGDWSERAQRGESCYANKITPEECYLDWRRDAPTLARWVRALGGKEYARCRLGDRILKIHSARAEDCAATAAPGAIVALDDEGALVRCGDGALRLSLVQMPGGRRALNGREMRNGRALAPGLQFETDG